MFRLWWKHRYQCRHQMRFVSTQCSQMRLRPWLCPQPRTPLGELTALPQTPYSWTLEMAITFQPSDAKLGYRGWEKGGRRMDGKGRKMKGEWQGEEQGRRGGNLEQGCRLAKAGPGNVVPTAHINTLRLRLQNQKIFSRKHNYTGYIHVAMSLQNSRIESETAVIVAQWHDDTMITRNSSLTRLNLRLSASELFSQGLQSPALSLRRSRSQTETTHNTDRITTVN